MKSSKKTDEHIRAGRNLTVDEVHQPCPDVSKFIFALLREEAGNFYNAWIKKKLIPRRTMCIVIHGVCVER